MMLMWWWYDVGDYDNDVGDDDNDVGDDDNDDRCYHLCYRCGRRLSFRVERSTGRLCTC